MRQNGGLTLRRSLSESGFGPATACIDGIAAIPMSSLTSLGMYFCVCPGAMANILKNSCGLKCTEQMHEFFVGSHLARFVLTKSTHCRLLFFAWGRSSPAKGILWRTIPLLISGVFEHPPTTHLFDIFPVFPSMYSVTKTRRQHCVPGLTSHSEPVLISVHSSKFGRSAKKRYFRYV